MKSVSKTHYTVTVHLAFGSGGMVGLNGQRHEHYVGNGKATARKLSTAIKMAEAQAYRQLGEGASYIPVWEEYTVYQNGRQLFSFKP